MCQPRRNFHNFHKPVGHARYAYFCPKGSRFTRGSVDEVVLTLYFSGQGLSADELATRRNRLRRRAPRRTLNNRGRYADPKQTKTDLQAGLKAGYLVEKPDGIWHIAESVLADLEKQKPFRCGDVDVKTP